MATVVIASLGDSPVVVTALFDLLQQEKNIDQLTVFYPEDSLALIGYEELILKPLQYECKVEGIPLYTEDVSSEEASYDFLRQLYLQLSKHQENGDSVYLSLAGGRKSMASLMALLAPLFPCVQELYHILDKDEGKRGHHFWSTRSLYDLAPADQQRHLFPPHERVKLIHIPYGASQHLNAEVKSLLYTITDERLEELWERDAELAEMVTYYHQMNKSDGQGRIISVELTKEVAAQYREMWKFDVTHAKNFAKCFDQMRFALYLDRNAHDIHAYKGRHFHYYKRRRTAERPVFHTEPVDIKAKPEANIQRVIVSDLSIEIEGRTPSYSPLKEIVKKLRFPLETEKLEDVLPQGHEESKDLILIIPLGTSPMVATQLYQLYIDRGNKVRSVILVHTQHDDVCDSVEIVCEAFKRAGVDCKTIPLEGWDDIDNTEACAAYQTLLEQTIQNTRQQNPSCQIELTISGGRKGMAALATFAAQHLGIHHVVHTVIHNPITDKVKEKNISDKVNEETTVEELKKLTRTNDIKKLDDRLFLYEYKENRDAFVLFNIPVMPAQKR